MKLKSMDRAEAVGVFKEYLNGLKTGNRDSITIFSGSTFNHVGIVMVEVVVLNPDGATLAYRLNTNDRDGDWQIGNAEDAVEVAICYRDTFIGGDGFLSNLKDDENILLWM